MSEGLSFWTDKAIVLHIISEVPGTKPVFGKHPAVVDTSCSRLYRRNRQLVHHRRFSSPTFPVLLPLPAEAAHTPLRFGPPIPLGTSFYWRMPWHVCHLWIPCLALPSGYSALCSGYAQIAVQACEVNDKNAAMLQESNCFIDKYLSWKIILNRMLTGHPCPCREIGTSGLTACPGMVKGAGKPHIFDISFLCMWNACKLLTLKIFFAKTVPLAYTIWLYYNSLKAQ